MFMPLWTKKVKKKLQERLQLKLLNSSENPDSWTDLFMDTHTKAAYNIWYLKE